jgi:Fe-S-cluster-containing dehydrogenase component
MDRLDKGEKPACVTVCVTHCLSFGPAETLPDIRRSRHAKSVAALE